MSKATKRKHVVKEVLSDYVQPTEHQLIVRVLGSPGNNLHEIETSEGEKFLASMPTKFRKNIWIKRGDYLIVDPIAEGDKVKAEIAFILYKDHQRLLQKEGLWPSGFEKKTESVTKSKESNQRAEADAPETKQSDESGTDSEDDSDLFVNTNRVYYEDSEEEESETDEEEK